MQRDVSMIRRALLLAGAVLLLPVCSSSNVGGGGDTVPVDAGAPDVETDASAVNDASDASDASHDTTLTFTTCSLHTTSIPMPNGIPENVAGFAGTNTLEGFASAKAECATTKMPASWGSSDGKTIDVFLKRYRAAKQPARGQLWLLAGGPGESGSVFEPHAFLIGKTLPDIDIYMPDHRGTGRSSFAPCAQLNGYTEAACITQVPYLAGLTTTNAARDLAALVERTRAPSQKVFIVGVSYGTYWAQRYLLVRPGQATAVVLDSPVPMVGDDFADFDEQFDTTARALLALCAADTTCAAKLGPDPVAKAREALDALDAGSCPAVASTIGDGRRYFGAIIGAYSYFARLLLPASVYRILRCDAGDAAWFSTTQKYVTTRIPESGSSVMVLANIALSELWLSTATSAELQAREKALLATTGAPAWFASLRPGWPTYPHDAYYGAWPSSSTPVLVLQGTLDPRTPYGDVVRPHYSGPGQYFVELPKADHYVLSNSPMSTPHAHDCAWQITQSFLADPSKAPDTSCTTGMAPLDFGQPPAEWLARVGIQELWESP